jgi:hypothetical protein
MENHLSSRRAGWGESDPVNDVVETTLEKGHQHLAGVSLAPLRPGEVRAKLPLENAVIVLDFLLLTEMEAILRRLSTALLDHARRSAAAFERALPGVTSSSFEKEFQSISATEAADRSGDASHGFPIVMMLDRSRGEVWQTELP